MRLAILLLSLIGGFSHLTGETPRALIVVTNAGQIEASDTPTGYFLSEVAHPWHVFTKAGFEVDFASPKGGLAPMDPKSFDLDDPINRELWETLDAVEALVHTDSLAALDLNQYEILFFAGGHGTMYDFDSERNVGSHLVSFYLNGGAVGAVCHGPAALVGAYLPSGDPFVQGKRVAGFTNEEEDAVELTDAMPFLLETRLREMGAEFVPGPKFEANVVIDGRLVTGQNPASARGAAEALVKLVTKE